MQLINNPGGVAVRSAAVWTAAIIAIITFVVNAMAGPGAPPWVAAHLPAEGIKQTWDWLLPILTFVGVTIARIIQQPSVSAAENKPT